MAKMSLGSYVFDVNPSTFKWGYKMNTNVIDTYGGRVVQLLSFSLTDVTVQGYIGGQAKSQGQFDAMIGFTEDMKSIMDAQAASKKSVLLEFPALGWKGKVFVTQYGSVKYSYDSSAVTYMLQMSVDTGFDEIVNEIRSSVALDALNNIPDGVNWTRSEFNTPSTSTWQASLAVIKKILADSGNYNNVSLSDYYEMLETQLQIENTESFSSVTDEESGNQGSSADIFSSIGGFIENTVSSLNQAISSAINDVNNGETVVGFLSALMKGASTSSGH